MDTIHNSVSRSLMIQLAELFVFILVESNDECLYRSFLWLSLLIVLYHYNKSGLSMPDLSKTEISFLNPSYLNQSAFSTKESFQTTFYQFCKSMQQAVQSRSIIPQQVMLSSQVSTLELPHPSAPQQEESVKNFLTIVTPHISSLSSLPLLSFFVIVNNILIQRYNDELKRDVVKSHVAVGDTKNTDSSKQALETLSNISIDDLGNGTTAIPSLATNSSSSPGQSSNLIQTPPLNIPPTTLSIPNLPSAQFSTKEIMWVIRGIRADLHIFSIIGYFILKFSYHSALSNYKTLRTVIQKEIESIQQFCQNNNQNSLPTTQTQQSDTSLSNTSSFQYRLLAQRVSSLFYYSTHPQFTSHLPLQFLYSSASNNSQSLQTQSIQSPPLSSYFSFISVMRDSCSLIKNCMYYQVYADDFFILPFSETLIEMLTPPSPSKHLSFISSLSPSAPSQDAPQTQQTVVTEEEKIFSWLYRLSCYHSLVIPVCSCLCEFLFLDAQFKSTENFKSDFSQKQQFISASSLFSSQTIPSQYPSSLDTLSTSSPNLIFSLTPPRLAFYNLLSLLHSSLSTSLSLTYSEYTGDKDHLVQQSGFGTTHKIWSHFFPPPSFSQLSDELSFLTQVLSAIFENRLDILIIQSPNLVEVELELMKYSLRNEMQQTLFNPANNSLSSIPQINTSNSPSISPLAQSYINLLFTLVNASDLPKDSFHDCSSCVDAIVEAPYNILSSHPNDEMSLYPILVGLFSPSIMSLATSLLQRMSSLLSSFSSKHFVSVNTAELSNQSSRNNYSSALRSFSRSMRLFALLVPHIPTALVDLVAYYVDSQNKKLLSLLESNYTQSAGTIQNNTSL